MRTTQQDTAQSSCRATVTGFDPCRQTRVILTLAYILRSCTNQSAAHCFWHSLGLGKMLNHPTKRSGYGRLPHPTFQNGANVSKIGRASCRERVCQYV